MKIRNGFVSNSSSSSFVILGVKRSGDYDEIQNEDLGEDIESLYVECSGYDYITGIVLSRSESDCDYLEDSAVSFSELNKMAIKISEALNVNIDQVELISGTHPC